MQDMIIIAVPDCPAAGPPRSAALLHAAAWALAAHYSVKSHPLWRNEMIQEIIYQPSYAALRFW